MYQFCKRNTISFEMEELKKGSEMAVERVKPPQVLNNRAGVDDSRMTNIKSTCNYENLAFFFFRKYFYKLSIYSKYFLKKIYTGENAVNNIYCINIQ